MRNIRKHPIKTTFIIIGLIILGLVGFVYIASLGENPQTISYGASFSKYHSDELELPWKEVYAAILDDLGVKKLRLSAHWPMVEGVKGAYNFSELDYQMKEAEKRGAEVILAIGKRLPGWPECHVPGWAKDLSSEDRNSSLLAYMTAVVERYKDSPALVNWQVENEAFLSQFATDHCDKVDPDFLESEIALVKSLDPVHQVIMTDSGEFGRWIPAYKRGDLFGTTMYLYVWHDQYGPLKYPIRPGFFHFKQNLAEWMHGNKKMILIELGLEPWLTKPIKDASLEDQFSRMGIDKMNEMIDFAKNSGFEEQYVWGAEWWYYLKQKGYPEHWERGKELFRN